MILELDIDGLGMADKDRNPHAGGCNFDLGIEDLLGLSDHLPLFLGLPILKKYVDMRDHVERDLLGEFLGRLVIGRVVDRFGLVPQFIHTLFASARYRLIGRDDNALDACAVVQRLERHNHLRGGTVGVGDDVLLGIAHDRIGVHFRHDERHVGVIAIERRVIDHDTARLGRLGGVDLGCVRPDGEQRHVPT